jgi:hypothetical protein
MDCTKNTTQKTKKTSNMDCTKNTTQKAKKTSNMDCTKNTTQKTKKTSNMDCTKNTTQKAKKTSNMDCTKNQGCTQLLAKGKYYIDSFMVLMFISNLDTFLLISLSDIVNINKVTPFDLS